MADFVNFLLLLNGLIGQLHYPNPHQVSQFGLNLLRAELDLNPAENALISPASISLALAMLHTGSAGRTQQQLDQLLPFLRNVTATSFCYAKPKEKSITTPRTVTTKVESSVITSPSEIEKEQVSSDRSIESNATERDLDRDRNLNRHKRDITTLSNDVESTASIATDPNVSSSVTSNPTESIRISDEISTEFPTPLKTTIASHSSKFDLKPKPELASRSPLHPITLNLTSSPKLWLLNQLIVDSNLRLSHLFEKQLKQNFESKVLHLNSTVIEDQISQLNKWAANATEQRITRLLSSIPSIGRNQLHVLSGLAFNAVWARPFAKQSIRSFDFENALRNRTRTDFMTADQPFPVADFPTHQLLSLAYEPSNENLVESSLRMLIILPTPKTSLAEAMKTITSTEQLLEQMKRLQSEWVNVRLPKFRLSKTTDLRPTLSRLGLTELFDTKANFSEMCRFHPNRHHQIDWSQLARTDGSGASDVASKSDAAEGSDQMDQQPDSNCLSLKVDEVQHTADLTLDEDGTRAAATTRISMSPRALHHSIDFYAQRPFAFILMADQIPLFVGALQNIP